MYDGKKGVAQKIVYDAFEIIREKTGKDPLEVFEAAMENVMPVLEVKARQMCIRDSFMTWEGYNYEDAVLINEKIVRDDVFTSIHIEAVSYTHLDVYKRQLQRGITSGNGR